jgi:hypothetical protein
MVGPTSLDGEEELALALRLSLLSPDDVDEQAVQLPSGESTPANDVSRPTTLPDNEDDDVALALRLSHLSPDDFDEQVARLYRRGPAPTGEDVRSSTPPNESDEKDLELALNLSQLPADLFDEQVSQLDRRGESRTAIEEILASLLMAMSLVEVRTTSTLYLGNH